MAKPVLALSDFMRAAKALGCSIPAIQAVCAVEAPQGGFDAADRPRVLFEGHKFSQATGGVYDSAYPSISYPTWTREHYATGPDDNARNAGEHQRLQLACSLNRDAALKSASWGRFQIMGFNHAAAGHATLQSFINAMYAGEGPQLDAFVAYVKSQKLDIHLSTLNWAAFARAYNGPAYADNRYDTKLQAAYKRSLSR